MRAAAPTRCVSSGTRFGLGTGKRHAGLLASRGNLPAQPSECHPRGGVVKSRTLRRPARRAVRSSSSDAVEPAEASSEAADAFAAPMHRSDGARSKGYFRWPALHGNLLVFVCEDDLHSVDVNLGGLPRRLTDTPGPARAPVFSPCGTHIAFTVAEDECEEVYVVHSKGGAAIKLTNSGAEYARVACWTPDGESLVFASSASAQFVDAQELWAVQIVYEELEEEEDNTISARASDEKKKKKRRTVAGASEPSRLRLGPANAASFRPGCAGRMLGRDARDPATRHWKGYKGGACGELWLDLNGANAFRRVQIDGFRRGDEDVFSFGEGASSRVDVDGDEQTSPHTVNVGDAAWASRDVVVLVADDGSGRANLCSFRVPPPTEEAETADEKKDVGAEDSPIRVTLVKHTSRRDFCVRHPALDAAAVARGDSKVTAVYASGGRLFSSVLDVSIDDDAKKNGDVRTPVAGREIPIEWRGAQAQCERFRLESPDEYVDDVTLHPEGLTVVATARGRAFAMGLWDGPAIELEPPTPTKRALSDFATAPPGSDALFDIAARGGSTFSGTAYAPRARLCAYLWDATRVAVVRDAAGEDDVEIHWEDGSRDAVSLNVPPAVLGRPVSLAASPESSLLAVVNHRAELLVVDCDSGVAKTGSLAKSKKNASSASSTNKVPVVRLADVSPESGGIRHVAWSPCGCWLAYTWHESAETSLVRVLDVRTGVVRDITAPILSDSSPAWDPAGEYLYFLSSRELEPAYDAARFGLSFHGSEKPHCVALRRDVRNPLLRALRPPHDGSSSSSDDEYDETSESDDETASDSDDETDAPPPIDIDFDGVFDRVVALPMPAGRYAKILGLDDEKFCVVRFPSRRPGRVGLDAPYYAGESDDGSEDDEDGVSALGGALLKFDMTSLRSSVLIEEGVKDACLSMDRRCVLLRVRNQSGYADEYRCYKAGAKPDDEDSDGEEIDHDAFDRRSGLIDLESRLDQIVVRPRAEWTQMLCEAWRVLRDEWWTESMAPGDASLEQVGENDVKNHAQRWTECLRRYARDVLPRAAARSEVNDVFAELSAELRSSHVAVGVGDAVGETRRRANATPGRLGCDAVWDPGRPEDSRGSSGNAQSSSSGYRITRLVKGDAWDALAGGALVKPGVNVRVGDVLLKINGRRLTKTRGVSEALVGLGGKEVSLTFRVADGSRDETNTKRSFPDDSTRDVREAMRDLRVSDGKKKKDNAAKKKKPAKATMTHPKFTPNPSAAKPDARRVPGSVVTVRVRAMHSELDARYRDLLQWRHDRVSELSNDQVGYLHVPDMERFGYGEFWRRFPRESKKKALVVDLRGNCGGHISELILAKLAQRPLAFDVPRRGAPTAYPSHASGFVVTLVDQDTGSDAELAAHAFRRTKLGPIVGNRTWGGLLTVAGGGARLVDGGYVSFPSQNVVAFEEEDVGENASFSGKRPGNRIENRGVVPDVCVVVSPSAHLRGEDPQLDAATSEALKLLRAASAKGDASDDTTHLSASGVSVRHANHLPSPESKRRDAALAAAMKRDGSGSASRDVRNGAGAAANDDGKNDAFSWPFRTFAPYPEASDSEKSESEVSAEDESESDEDVRRRAARGKPKGASRRR